MDINKEKLFKDVVEKLEDTLKILIESALEAKEASTNEESKAENKYDTRGLEASYLASGQAQRVKELEESIFNLKKVELKRFGATAPIGISALVRVSIDDRDKKWFFLLPASGIRLDTPLGSVQTLSLESPIGKALFQAQQGDEVEYRGKEYEILEVH